MNLRFLHSIFLIAMLFTTPLFSQTKKELETKRTKLQTEIKQINKLLSKTKKSEKNVLLQISDINKKIKVHQDIINTIKKENKIFITEITNNKKEIETIETQLTKLKSIYKKTVVNSYKSKNKNSRLLFLLSAKDFMQAYKRLKYMNQISDYRKNQAKDIVIKRNKLVALNDSILLKKKVKDSLISIQLEERKVVDVEKAKKETLLKIVKNREKKYTTQIKLKQKKEREYDKKIENYIVKVIKKSNNNKIKSKRTKNFVLTAESKKLASSFAKNKGKLPAPVEKGFISRYFGQRKHEVMKKLDVNSSGWHYTTPKNTKARAIFNGKISGIMVDKNTKIKTVIIQHGNYMTVYSNLQDLLVEKGDKVTTKQELGTVHTNKTTGKTIIKFQLWKDAKPQDPKFWIYKR